jgi:predicted small metal-binding protein
MTPYTFENETESAAGINKLLVIYPGRFQPFHKGHKAVFDHLVSKYGTDNVFIATSDKVALPKSPFNFDEKIKMMKLTGLPVNRVVKVKNPYQAQEITQTVDPDSTAVIFAVSKKDMAEDPRFSFKPKKDGSPSYFQPMPSDSNTMAPLSKHGYITTVPTFNFKVLGEPMKSATEIRAMFPKLDPKQQALLIKDLFGAYSEDVHELLANKIVEHTEIEESCSSLPEDIINRIDAIVDSAKSLPVSLQDKLATVLSSLAHNLDDMPDDKILSTVSELEGIVNSPQNSTKYPVLIDTVKINNLLEHIISFDNEDIMKSEVSVDGYGTMTVDTLIMAIRRFISELNDQAETNEPQEYRNINAKLKKGVLQSMLSALITAFDDINARRRQGGKNSKSIPKDIF